MHGLRIAQKAPESKIVTQNEPEFLMQSFSEFDGKRCALKAEKMTDNSKILKKVEVLKDALISEKVRFPNSLQCEYEELCVFRGVRYTATKTAIDKSDFLLRYRRN